MMWITVVLHDVRSSDDIWEHLHRGGGRSCFGCEDDAEGSGREGASGGGMVTALC